MRWRVAIVLAVAAVTAVCARPQGPAAVAPHGPATARRDPREAALFRRLGCADCHAISALGVRAPHDVGPDLTFAYGDVVIRYGVNLESFLANPSGVMRLMLAAHLDLGPPQRDSIVQILRRLHAERRADAGELMAPHAGRRP
jgi:hypothetical protein